MFSAIGVFLRPLGYIVMLASIALCVTLRVEGVVPILVLIFFLYRTFRHHDSSYMFLSGVALFAISLGLWYGDQKGLITVPFIAGTGVGLGLSGVALMVSRILLGTGSAVYNPHVASTLQGMDEQRDYMRREREAEHQRQVEAARMAAIYEAQRRQLAREVADRVERDMRNGRY